MTYRTKADHQRDWDERLERMRAKVPAFKGRADGKASSPRIIYRKDGLTD